MSSTMTTTHRSTDSVQITYITAPLLKIDWPQLARDMQEEGMSYAQQALTLNITASSYQRYLPAPSNPKPVTPRYDIGHAIICLHAKICGIKLTQLRLEQAIEVE